MPGPSKADFRILLQGNRKMLERDREVSGLRIDCIGIYRSYLELTEQRHQFTLWQGLINNKS